MTEIQQSEQAETQIDAQQTESKLTNKQIIAYLAEKFPLAFSLEGEAKPLKIGIFQDLAEALKDDETLSKTQLRHALRQYTSNWRYLHGCRLGAERVDLAGNPAGTLDQQQADHAAQQLAEAKAKFAEKRAAERVANPKANKKKPAAKPQFKKDRVNADKAKAGKAQSERTQSAPRQPKAPLQAVDFATLTKGSAVKVKIADSVKRAQVLEVNKEDARVQLENGLVMTLSADRLFN